MIPAENVFVGDWSKVVYFTTIKQYEIFNYCKKYDTTRDCLYFQMAQQPKLADAVAICTTDKAHTGPALGKTNIKYSYLILLCILKRSRILSIISCWKNQCQ